jgi:ATP/maltotriose-dependent transcriptional regulator MalT
MASSTTPRFAFVGRTEEVAALLTAVEGAVAGRPSLVWIQGEAGSGKTTLVRQAAGHVPKECVTVWAQGDELAAEVPYELARQLGAHTEGGFAAGQEILSTWAGCQEGGPVVVVVEDLHWADPGSALALLAAVRRLDEDRLCVIVTSRRDPADAWERFARDDGRYQHLVLPAFDRDDVTALAAQHGIDLSSRQADRLTRHTRGHPLWVRTLLAELTEAELQTTGDLPAPRSLASAVTARLGEIPVAGRDLGAALAVINRRAPLAVVGRIAGIPQPAEALEALLVTGFVQWNPRDPGSSVEFTHPLYRLAIYEDLSPTRRRDLHRRAAQVLTPAAALAHRVAATDGVDEGLADELQAAAASEWADGALALAGRNLLWASALSASTERSEELLVQAGLAFLDAGQAPRAALLRAQIQAGGDSPAHSLVLGLIDWELGDPENAEQWFRKATDSPTATHDRPYAARAWAQLAEIFVVEGRARDGVGAARQALVLAEKDEPAERLAWIHRSVGEAMQHGGPAGIDCLNRRLATDPELLPGREVDMLVTRASLGYYSARLGSTMTDLRVVLRLARRGSVPKQLARCHYLMAATLMARGDWDDALVHARTALSLAADDQLVWVQPQCHAVLGMLLAYRGDGEGAQHHVSRARTLAAHQGNLEATGLTRLAAAARARTRGEPDRVIEELGVLAASPPMMSGLYFWPPLIRALIDSGQLDEAVDQLTRMSDAGQARRIDVESATIPLRARLAAASGEPGQAADLFEEALARFGPDDPFLERALVRQDYGRFLTLRGDRRRGIDQLRAAHDMLSAAGAQPFVARVETDLAAAGLPSRTASRSRSRSALDLTDRERDVATLVAQGMSNPEVAAQLYVSRKAVEYHLRNIYGKLGITSRRELRNRQVPA